MCVKNYLKKVSNAVLGFYVLRIQACSHQTKPTWYPQKVIEHIFLILQEL